MKLRRELDKTMLNDVAGGVNVTKVPLSSVLRGVIYRRDEGHPKAPLYDRDGAYTQICPDCGFICRGDTEVRARASLVTHFVYYHNKSEGTF